MIPAPEPYVALLADGSEVPLIAWQHDGTPHTLDPATGRLVALRREIVEVVAVRLRTARSPQTASRRSTKG